MLFDRISLHFACNFSPTIRVPVCFSCDISAQILSGLRGKLYFEKRHIFSKFQANSNLLMFPSWFSLTPPVGRALQIKI